LRHNDIAAAERQVAVRRRDNANGARAKSPTTRTIPVSGELIRLYADYLYAATTAVMDLAATVGEPHLPCKVDGDEPPPDLVTILRDWQVHLLDGLIPTSLEQYRVDKFDGEFPNGIQPQACAVKFRRQPWRLGVLRTLSGDIEVEVLIDTVRLITGHIHGFGLKYKPQADGQEILSRSVDEQVSGGLLGGWRVDRSFCEFPG
jgi:hypothetical protein